MSLSFLLRVVFLGLMTVSLMAELATMLNQ